MQFALDIAQGCFFTRPEKMADAYGDDDDTWAVRKYRSGRGSSSDAETDTDGTADEDEMQPLLSRRGTCRYLSDADGDAKSLRRIMRAATPGAVGSVAARTLTSHKYDTTAWLQTFGPLEIHAAKWNETFLPPLPLDELSADDLTMLKVLEAAAARPIAVVLQVNARSTHGAAGGQRTSPAHAHTGLPDVVPAGVVLAGGSIARAMAHIIRGETTPRVQPAHSDIDYFVSPSVTDIKTTMGGILPASHLAVTTGPCVTTVVPDRSHHPLVQLVVHEHGGDWRHLVADFDFVHLQVAHVGDMVYASVAAVLAWRSMTTAVPSMRDPSLHVRDYRIGKAKEEGFAVSTTPSVEDEDVIWAAYKANALELMWLLRETNTSLALVDMACEDKEDARDMTRTMFGTIAAVMKVRTRRDVAVCANVQDAFAASRTLFLANGGKFLFDTFY